MHAAVGTESTVEQGQVRRLPATLLKRILPTEPDVDLLCGNACITKHMKCSREPANTKMVTRTFWTDGIRMTKTANLCQMLDGLRNRSFKTKNGRMMDSCSDTSRRGPLGPSALWDHAAQVRTAAAKCEQILQLFRKVEQRAAQERAFRRVGPCRHDRDPHQSHSHIFIIQHKCRILCVHSSQHRVQYSACLRHHLDNLHRACCS